MSSVQIDGIDYKRCGHCAEWTDYDDLKYIPPVEGVVYSEEKDREFHDRLSYAMVTHPKGFEYRRVIDDEANRAWISWMNECFGQDVCRPCWFKHMTKLRVAELAL